MYVCMYVGDKPVVNSCLMAPSHDLDGVASELLAGGVLRTCM